MSLNKAWRYQTINIKEVELNTWIKDIQSLLFVHWKNIFHSVIWFGKNRKGDGCGAGTAYPSGAPKTYIISTQIHNRPRSMFDTRTWIKVAGINQIYGPKPSVLMKWCCHETQVKLIGSSIMCNMRCRNILHEVGNLSLVYIVQDYSVLYNNAVRPIMFWGLTFYLHLAMESSFMTEIYSSSGQKEETEYLLFMC
jgi:hypothetical protein